MLAIASSTAGIERYIARTTFLPVHHDGSRGIIVPYRSTEYEVGRRTEKRKKSKIPPLPGRRGTRRSMWKRAAAAGLDEVISGSVY